MDLEVLWGQKLFPSIKLQQNEFLAHLQLYFYVSFMAPLPSPCVLRDT